MRALRLLWILGFFLLLVPAFAADPAPAPVPGERSAVSTERYLERLATLLLIRAKFSVIPDDEIPEALEAALERLGGDPPPVGATELLDASLLAEASYFIVSLKYLTLSGGAAWPADKAETTYANDALVVLDRQLLALQDGIAGGDDVLPLLIDVDRIAWQTEGFADVPAGEDRFARRDALVSEALQRSGPQSGA